MYTTLPALTPDDDPINNDTVCSFEYVATLQDSEDIEVSLCGYTESDNTKMIGISLQIPPLRWFSIGFITDSAFDANNAMKDVYAIVVEPSTYPRSVAEYHMNGNGDIGDMLETTVTIISDDNIDGYRYIQLTRKVTVSDSDLSDQTLAQLPSSDYFNFAIFEGCDDSMRVLWAFGKSDNEKLAFHGYNEQAGSVKAIVEAVDGVSCDEMDIDSKGAKISMIGGLVLSVIAFLFLS